MHVAARYKPDARPSGISAVGDLPWGTHLSQFFRTREDLIDVLVPFFKAGLEANERCIWITAQPLEASEATAALRDALPDLDRRIERGQIDIFDYRDWYIRNQTIGADDVLRGWLSREAEARACGYDGLRITGNTIFLERSDWDNFAMYEASVHRAFHSQRILALCSYSLEKCSANDIIDVLRHHRFALVRRDGAWQSIQSATQVLAAVKADIAHPDDIPATSAPEILIPEIVAPADTHAVRFFESGTYPADAFASYLREGLALGEGALIFASNQHNAAIEAALRAQGLDVASLIEMGQLIFRDAHAIARSLLKEKRPDRAVFEATVAKNVEEALSTFPAVRAYGEIVDVLAAAGEHSAAIELERWWNELLHEKAVTLLCGYTLDNFSTAHLNAAFQTVCHSHSKVAPAHAGASRDYGHVLAELEQTRLALRRETGERARIEHEKNGLLEAERLLRVETHSVNEHLARLQNLTSAMSEATTLADIGRSVIAGLTKTFAADMAAFWIATDDGELALLSQTNGASSSVFDGLILDGSPLAQTYRTRRPIWLGSSDQIAHAVPAIRKEVPQAQALGCLPLILRDYCLGAITLLYTEQRSQNASQRALLEDYVKQIALAVERARSYEDAHRSRARLQMLADAGRRVAQASLDFSEIMNNLAHEVTHAQFADGCTVCMLNDDNETLSLVALNHIDETREELAKQMLRNIPVKLGQGIVGAVAQSGVAMRMTTREQVAAKFNPNYAEYLKSSGICTLLAVPVQTPNGVIGVITATRDYPNMPFNAEDAQFLQDLADRSALSIENAKLYERAQQERERAEAANAAKDEFLAMLGHELRNPLSPILTASQLMRLRGGDMLSKERTIIERQVHHMVRLVDDLLDVSRITRGKIELKRAPVEMAQIVANAVEMASPLLEERRHRLVTAVPPSGLLVDADAQRIAQVIANLLNNAAKYTPPDGMIKITGETRDGKVSVHVSDNGVGIEPELLPRIFNLFAQGKQASDRANGGLGLGLAIAKSLAELHDGALSAKSEGTGKGSEFTLEIPLAASAEKTFDETPSCDDNAQTTGFRILVVDDNADAADSLSEVLEMLGHMTCVAYDGPSALRVAETFRPQLALLDIGLPAMDGYELGQRLKETLGAAAPKLVALTGYGQVADRRRSADAGFAHHLVKPLDFDCLEEVIDELFPKPEHTL